MILSGSYGWARRRSLPPSPRPRARSPSYVSRLVPKNAQPRAGPRSHLQECPPVMSEALAKGLLSRQRRLHFIGVGGAGMSGIAELSLRLGFAVSGCDSRLGPTTDRLAALGVQIFQGHHPDHVADQAAARTAAHFADHLTP